MSTVKRCLGLNKNKKRCRKKLKEGQYYYCCDAHKPINMTSDNTIECFHCCEDVKPYDLWNVKCGHSFHKDCMKLWLKKFSENQENPEYYQEKDFQCPLCRQNIYKPRNITLKKANYNKADNYHDSEILKLCKY